MSVIFSQDTTGVSTLQAIVNALHTALTTVPATPWVLESAYFVGILPSSYAVPATTNATPFPTTAAPTDPTGTGQQYCTLIYKIGDFGTFVASPWRIKLKFSNGTSTTYGVRIEITTGSAVTGTANTSGADIANPGTTMVFENNNTTAKTVSEWFVTVYESGLAIMFFPSANASNGLLSLERARNLTATRNDSILVMMTGDNTNQNQPTVEGFLPLINTGNALGKKIACRARRYPPGTEHAPAEAIILRSSDTFSATPTMVASAVIYDPTGAATPAGATMGPFPISAGVHGTPRLFVLVPYADYVAGNSVAITHDGVGRNIRIPSSFSSTSYYAFCPLKD